MVKTLRNVRRKYGKNFKISKNTVQSIVDKFYRGGSVHDLHRTGRRRTGRSNENIEAVRESVAESPNTSIRHRSQELAISRATLHRILRIDLKLHPYKVQLVQEIKIRDHFQRKVFAEWALERLEEDEQFLAKILFSDEAHFHV